MINTTHYNRNQVNPFAMYGFLKYEVNILFSKKPIYSCNSIHIQEGDLILCEDKKVFIIQLRFVEYSLQTKDLVDKVYENIKNNIPNPNNTKISKIELSYNKMVLPKYGIFADIDKNIFTMYYLKGDYNPIDYSIFKSIKVENITLIKVELIKTLANLIQALHTDNKVMGFFHPNLLCSNDNGFKVMDYSFNNIFKEMKRTTDMYGLFFGFLDIKKPFFKDSNENMVITKQNDMVLLILFTAYLFTSHEVIVPYEKLLTYLKKDLITNKPGKAWGSNRYNFLNFMSLIRNPILCNKTEMSKEIENEIVMVSEFIEDQLKSCVKETASIENFQKGLDKIVSLSKKKAVCTKCEEILLNQNPLYNNKNSKKVNEENSIIKFEDTNMIMDITQELDNTIIKEINNIQLKKNSLNKFKNCLDENRIKINYSCLIVLCDECYTQERNEFNMKQIDNKTTDYTILNQKAKILITISNLTPELKNKDMIAFFNNNIDKVSENQSVELN